MPTVRASSGLLRSRIRPGYRRLPQLHQQTRTQIRGKDDLGGPGGQDSIPKSPSGADVFKRNWGPIAGLSVLLLGAYAYLTGSPQKPSTDVSLQGSAARSAEQIKQEARDSAKEVGREMSGKKGGGMGGFRGE